ncbi:MAG: ISAzo13 family transposase [Chloroflexota bacterium]|nr:ISAzo13 family transposase [Chloroflexota bacterium]
MDEQGVLACKLASILPQLNERQRRLVLAAEARALGHGGVTRVARAAQVSRTTVHAALTELDTAVPDSDRSRRSGGGRTSCQESDPTLVGDLEALIEPTTRGDPMSPLRWTCKSTRQLAAALQAQGHPVSYRTVARLLQQLEYSLQAPRKVLEGGGHPDRDAQFDYLNGQVTAALAAGQPVISVDAKKKELVGPYKNGGQEWQPQGQPERVNVYDFVDKQVGKAIPYGIYDVGRNTGWVNVGQDHDTAQFAIESLRRWWQSVGAPTYPQAERLLICADGGGSNGVRVRLWKVALQALADETGLQITVCHLPPGTSKWNKIEHRLFAHISLNWRGRPLVSHEVIVELIGATTTRTGLTVQAVRDTGGYPTKIKVSDEELAAVRLTPHAFHGEWNYTISPAVTMA